MAEAVHRGCIGRSGLKTKPMRGAGRKAWRWDGTGRYLAQRHNSRSYRSRAKGWQALCGCLGVGAVRNQATSGTGLHAFSVHLRKVVLVVGGVHIMLLARASAAATPWD